jgi:hypothetical protein
MLAALRMLSILTKPVPLSVRISIFDNVASFYDMMDKNRLDEHKYSFVIKWRDGTITVGFHPASKENDGMDC